jgi:hypothetical protein
VTSVAFVTTEHNEASLGPAKVPQVFGPAHTPTILGPLFEKELSTRNATPRLTSVARGLSMGAAIGAGSISDVMLQCQSFTIAHCQIVVPAPMRWPIGPY